jgi:hypothetical protein
MPGFVFPPSSDERVHLTAGRLWTYVVPLLVLYYVTALLACTPNTRQIRLALFPITISLAYYAAVSLDPSGGDPLRKAVNFGYCVSPTI